VANVRRDYAVTQWATTLATAVIERPHQVDLTEVGVAVEWVKTMNQIVSQQATLQRRAWDTPVVQPPG
jgi:hypothetical protein